MKWACFYLQIKTNVLVASAWAKSSGNASAASENSNAKFRLCLTVYYGDGQSEEYIENHDTGYSGWKYVAIPFVLNQQTQPVSATLKLDYTANIGTCYFTNVRLVAVDGIVTTNTYRTDENPVNSIEVFDECKDIKLKTTKQDSVQTTVDYIDESSDIVRTVVMDKNGRSFITDYQYDDKHNLIKTQDYRGLVIEYTYTEYGKKKTRKTYHKDTSGMYMFSEYTYQDENFNPLFKNPRLDT